MKIRLLVLGLLLSTISFAQVNWQTEVQMKTPAEFSYTGDLIYTWHYNANTYYKYTLTLFDNNLKELNKIEVENKKLTELTDAIAVGGDVYFYFLSGKEATLMKVDATGQKVKEISFEDEETDVYELFLRTDGNKLFVGRSIKPKKRGFLVECYDASLVKKWSYEKVPDKGSDGIKAMEASGDGVILLTSFAKNAFSSSSYSGLALDANGKEVGTTAIEVPNYFSILSSRTLVNGHMMVMSTYGNGPEALPDMPSGLLLHEIDSKGAVAQTYDLSFEDLGEQIMPMESTRPFGNTAPALHPVDLIEANGTTTLLCESFYFQKIAVSTGSTTTTTPSKEANFYMLDLIQIKLNNGDFEISKTSKPYQSIKFENIMVVSSGKIYEQMVEDRGYSYQFSHNGQVYIKGWLRNFHYYNPTTLNHDYVDVDNRVFYGRPFFGLNNPSGISGKIVRNPDFGINHQLAYSGLMKFDTHFLVYEYRLGVLKATKVNL